MNRCPFCGGASCVTQETNELGGEEYCVQCNRCGAQGFVTSIKQEAIEAWNQRWVPPIVWESGGWGIHNAYAARILAGQVTVVNSVRVAWTCGKRIGYCNTVDEATVIVEAAWREAYLEMHR